MNYIFLDLEWNNSYWPKEKCNINEIIEVGAIKYDSEMNYIDDFSQLIKSQITDRFSNKFKNITHISEEESNHGITFVECINLLEEWIDNGDLVITWSSSDLYTICENYRHFLKGRDITIINYYLDLQKLFMRYIGDSGNQISLKNAADKLNINSDDDDFHRSLYDSKITAEIFKKIYTEINYTEFIKKDEINKINSGMKVSYVITDLDSPYLKPKDFNVKCKYCKKNLVRKSKWKAKKKGNFIALHFCPSCRKGFWCKFTFRLVNKKVIAKKNVYDIKK